MISPARSMDATKKNRYFEQRLALLQDGALSFDDLAMEVFHYQAVANPVYKRFLELTGQDEKKIDSVCDVPFLPVQFFKSKRIQSGEWKPEAQFSSSGTTGMVRSRHFIHSLSHYEQVSRQIFEAQIGNLDQFQILGLLPGYLDNPESSLIHMVKSFESHSSPISFFRLDFPALETAIQQALSEGKTPLIFSVTYALLKMEEEKPMSLQDCVVIETGGMKGLGREMCKAEILEILQNRLEVKSLHSEYGMSEMQSQAYGTNGLYRSGYSMRVLRREVEDPLGESLNSGRGALNIVDLANFATCSFIATEDLGRVHNDLEFEVFGRLDESEIRGCNLLFS
jgi:hypothetical protein